jgi:hypothetical protein
LKRSYPMRNLVLFACLAFAASVLPMQGASLPQDVPAKALKKIHEWNAVIVSIDTEREVITFKDENGKSWTIPAASTILTKMKNLKPGEKVNLTCEDDPNGVHESIVKFKPVKTGAK